MGLSICFLTGIAAQAAAQFRQPISRDQKAGHALNRLTFGPRPGDLQHVRKLGLKKWIDLQLHPQRIPENPVLETKLRPLDTLGMTTAKMLESYPSPALVKQMVAGKLPFPEDPDKRMMVDRLAARLKSKTDQDSSPSPAPDLAALLPPEQLRVLRAGAPQQKLDLFNSFSEDRQDRVLETMGQGMRMQLFAAAPPALRRRIQSANGPQAMVAQDLMAAKLLRAVYSNRQLEEVLDRFLVQPLQRLSGQGRRPLPGHRVRARCDPPARARANSRTCWTLPPRVPPCCSIWTTGNRPARAIRSHAARRRRRGLNENYGRELLELHTLGVDGGYTQKDVTEVARCFTGWTIKQPAARRLSSSSIRAAR